MAEPTAHELVFDKAEVKASLQADRKRNTVKVHCSAPPEGYADEDEDEDAGLPEDQSDE